MSVIDFALNSQGNPNAMANGIVNSAQQSRAQPSNLSKIANFTEQYWNKPFEGARNGVVEGLGNIPISVLNMFLESPSSKVNKLAGGLRNKGINIPDLPESSGPSIPHINLEKYDEDSDLKSGFRQGSNILSQILGPAKLIKSTNAGKLIPTSGQKRLITEALKNYGIGYATGENEEGDDWSRHLSGTLSAAGGSLLGKSKKSLAQDIPSRYEKISKKIGNEFDNIIKDSNQYNINVPIPQGSTQRLSQQLSNNEMDALAKFYAHPTVENAHRAQSDIGKALQRLKQSRGLTPVQDAIEEGQKLQNELLDVIGQGLESNKNTKGLAKRYFKARKDYEAEVIPYKESAAFQNRRNVSPSHTIKALQGEEEFLHKVGRRHHPELAQNEALNNVLKWLGIGSAGSVGALGTKKFWDSLNE